MTTRGDHVERNGLDELSGEARLFHCHSERESTGNHPQYAPRQLLEVASGDDSGHAEHAYRKHCHDIGIHTGNGIGKPQQDCEGEGDIDYDVFFCRMRVWIRCGALCFSV